MLYLIHNTKFILLTDLVKEDSRSDSFFLLGALLRSESTPRYEHPNTRKKIAETWVLRDHYATTKSYQNQHTYIKKNN